MSEPSAKTCRHGVAVGGICFTCNQMDLQNVTEKVPEPAKADPVNPGHYKSGGIEAIDVIEAFDLNFRLANVVKYVLRAHKKGQRKTDLQKALWYLQREVDKGG